MQAYLTTARGKRDVGVTISEWNSFKLDLNAVTELSKHASPFILWRKIHIAKSKVSRTESDLENSDEDG